MDDEPELTLVPPPKHPPKPPREPGTVRDIAESTLDGGALGDLPGAGIGLAVGLWARVKRWQRKRSG